MNSAKNWTRCNAHAFWKKEALCSHVVQIYENDDEFLNLLEGFVIGGIASGDAVVLIATDAHLTALEKKLIAAGLEPMVLKASDQYIPLIAEEVLAQIMVNDWPDYSLFMESIATFFGRARKGNRNVRAFGEMVAILWEQGKSGATMMLEQLWNMYAEKEQFSLFCAYPGSSFSKEPAISLQNICKNHSKIISGVANSSSELTYLNIN